MESKDVQSGGSKISGHSEFSPNKTPVAAVNADSTTNAQGEFHPSKPKEPPIATSGHQPGRQVGNEAVPEFHAKTLPPGTAPKESTFKPNPVNEIPGQANNPDTDRSHGKEATGVSAQDTIVGATSADVHTGLGHPGSGQTAADNKNKRDPATNQIGQGEGGSGLTGEPDAAAQKLMQDQKSGPKSAREHNVSLDGAESKEPVHAEQLQSMGQKERQQDYDRTSSKPPGPNA